MDFSGAEYIVGNQTDKTFCFQETYIPVGNRQAMNMKGNKERSLVISNRTQKSTDTAESDRRTTSLAWRDREGSSQRTAVSRDLRGQSGQPCVVPF